MKIINAKRFMAHALIIIKNQISKKRFVTTLSSIIQMDIFIIIISVFLSLVAVSKNQRHVMIINQAKMKSFVQVYL